MAIIQPLLTSTYADSTYTEGPSRKCVLAQFDENDSLQWVGDLRSALGTDEVKFKHLSERRPRLKQDRDLWSHVKKGVARATIFISDPTPIREGVRLALKHEGALEGFEAFIHGEGARPEHLLLYSRLLFRAARGDEGGSVLRELVANDPGPGVLEAAVRVLLDAGRTDRAAE